MDRVNRRMRADMTEKQYDAFRKEMRRLRKVNGLTLTALAELAECSSAHISQIELGRKYPSNELAKDIADVFGLTVSEMCGSDDTREINSEIARNFGKAYLEKRVARGFKMSEVAGFAGITKEAYMDFEGGKCSLGESVLKNLDRLYAVEREIETVEVIKEVAAECPVSLDLVDKILGHITDINVSKDEQRNIFRELSEARAKILETRLFG